jgi:hypothetical protein
MLGPTAEDLDDRTATASTRAGIDGLLEKGRRILPALLDEEVTSVYAGLRAATEHTDYQISAHRDLRYVCLGGIRSTGLTSSMALAEEALARLVDCGLEARPKGVDRRYPHDSPRRARRASLPTWRPDRVPLRAGHRRRGHRSMRGAGSRRSTSTVSAVAAELWRGAAKASTASPSCVNSPAGRWLRDRRQQEGRNRRRGPVPACPRPSNCAASVCST